MESCVVAFVFVKDFDRLLSSVVDNVEVVENDKPISGAGRVGIQDRDIIGSIVSANFISRYVSVGVQGCSPMITSVDR